ncbi:MAG: GH3 auxin-responsive promoter family protein, partial [Bacteroidetes bacterium]|nr:GH3 auxin-responsive promoter family protein [Bacteroidota bacterium]
MSSLLKTITDNPLIKLTTGSGRAYARQQRVLKKMLLRAGNTAFGKEYHFDDILFSDHVIPDFQKQVPFHTYKEMNVWWKRAYEGEKAVTWPGKTKYFALSSGTSEGASKYIPVTKQMIRAITRASMRQLVSIGRNRDIPKEVLTKQMLLIGGSTDLNFNGVNFCGDLSGITTGNVPFFAQPLTKPDLHIRAKKNWDEKINDIVNEASKWDISMVAGVPAWVQIIFERIIEHYHVKTIHDIWPNLQVYTWGGVSIEPYRKSIDKLCAKPLQYWETYLASEGFFSFQSRQDSKGMKLILNNGIFFEFIPFDDNHFDSDGNLLAGAQAITVKDVKKDVNYAIVISTCSGAWRYLIGDTVTFVNLKNLEIKITGRTKHYLSICGEHLSVDNMNTAVQDTA